MESHLFVGYPTISPLAQEYLIPRREGGAKYDKTLPVAVPSTTKILSRSSPVIRNFSLLLCCPFKQAKLSLLIWFGDRAGDSWWTWKEQNLSPGAGWLVQPGYEYVQISGENHSGEPSKQKMSQKVEQAGAEICQAHSRFFQKMSKHRIQVLRLSLKLVEMLV